MSLNLCQFIGRLGQDVSMSYLQDGTAVANISIACSERWKDKQTGAKKEKTEWIRASAFGRQAEIIAEYFRKGSQIYISGKMQTRKYQDQQGQDKFSTDIRIGEFKFLDKKDDNQNDNQQQGYQSPQNNNQRNRQQRPQNNQPTQGNNQTQSQQQWQQNQNNTNSQNNNQGGYDYDDDIPFNSLNCMIKNHLI